MKKITNIVLIALATLLLASLVAFRAGAAPAADMEKEFANPPESARLRCFWWWLNGNVTKEAITRDLEEMRAKGLGGALIFDAGGAGGGGSGAAGATPAGPQFGSAAWRELFRHALREADRLGIEIGLNIQSGWNLGGPDVKPEEAAKVFTWAETRIEGGRAISVALPKPASVRHDFYRDVAVLAWPAPHDSARREIHASSSSENYGPEKAADGDETSFWASNGKTEGEGPRPGREEWLEIASTQAMTITGTTVKPRPGYGPKQCELQARGDDGVWKKIAGFSMTASEAKSIETGPVTARAFRLLISSSYDPKYPKAPRNVQVAEWRLHGVGPVANRRPIQNLAAKTASVECGGSNPATTYLLNDAPPTPGEEDALAAAVIDLTGKMTAGRLQW
ncbi:MAG: glycosyl hydrolase, partial [Candidatus Sumerlaeota bacterium]|nr:glycosyl hydrolase [Candidatus Sumerlaeota bacterium]